MATSSRSHKEPATPIGSICTEWELDQGVASRVVYTPERFPAGCMAGVRISAIQVVDGSFETAAEVPHIYLDCHPDSGLTIDTCPRSLTVDRIAEVEPERIILIKADVFRAAYPALAAAGLPVSGMRIPFPSSGRQKEFAVTLGRALAGE